MKKLFTLSAALFLSILIFSCSKDKNNDPATPGGNTPYGLLKAKIDGNDFSTDETMAIEVQAPEGRSIVISAGEGEDIGLSITIYMFNGIGEYTLNDPQNPMSGTGIYMDETDLWSTQVGGGGTLKITGYKPNESIEGTFHFTAKSAGNGTTKTISEGSFNIMHMNLN